MILVLWLCALLVQPATLAAQTVTPSLPQVKQEAAAVSVTWTNRQPRDGDTPSWQNWPTVAVHGMDLPAQLITVQLSGDTSPEVVINRLDSRAWMGRSTPYTATQLPTRTLSTGEVYPPLVAASNDPQLPESPVVLLREGAARGQRFAVFALTPIFAVTGEVREVSRLDFVVDGATLVAEESVHVADADWRLAAEVAGPSPISQQTALRVTVHSAGLQEIALRDVINAGLVTAGEVDRLQLYLADEEVALEVDESARVLRFYAPKVGNRWNYSTIYWLIRGQSAGLRMDQRPAGDSTGNSLPIRATGWETGQWSTPLLYVSQAAGPDGDHWFMDDLRAGPDLPSNVVTLTTALGLPPINALATMTLTGQAYVGNEYTLDLVTSGRGGEGSATVTWQGRDNWAASFNVPADTHQVVAELQSSTTPKGIRIDKIEWRRPVALSFGGLGGFFETSEHARYRLSGLPANFTLYDITTPDRPVRVDTSTADDGNLVLDSEAGRRYVVAPDSLPTIYLPTISGSASASRVATADAAAQLNRLSMWMRPVLSTYRPANLNSAYNAEVLYISHRAFLDALTPLVLARQAQGYTVAVVDVQSIYDGWSGGQISPQAIRAFLRYAAATGSRAPIAVTLIGDGTSDPLNYTGRNNVTYIPPYLIVVDPWLGETACESCYAQLDGDDPLSDSLMDMKLGRVPVKSAEELTGYIAKLLPYENDPVAAMKRNSMLYVTDNYRNTDGTVDAAGDFTVVAEQSIGQQPAHMQVDRVYYDPMNLAQSQPWRISDAVRAYESTLSAWQKGPGFITYIGHAHHWQWASTDLNATPPYLLGLYDPDALNNQADPSIVLGLTCLTGAFQTPAFAGTTIDERMLLNPKGGAVAVWGSTGLGVGYGHDSLQRGFYRQYWSSQPGETIGDLVLAGYLELFSRGVCCQETLRTFSLLGDPLTVPMVGAERYWIYAPEVSRD